MAQASALPGALNFYGVAGDSFAHLLTLTHQDGTAATETNAYAISVAAVYDGSTPVAFTVTRPTTNSINLALSAAATQSLGAGSFSWLLSWNEGSGFIRTILSGRIILEEIP